MAFPPPLLEYPLSTSMSGLAASLSPQENQACHSQQREQVSSQAALPRMHGFEGKGEEGRKGAGGGVGSIISGRLWRLQVNHKGNSRLILQALQAFQRCFSTMHSHTLLPPIEQQLLICT